MKRDHSRAWRRALLLGAWAALLTPLAGCVTNTVQQVREARTGLADGDAVVVLGRRSRPSDAETELDFIACVGNSLGKGKDGVAVVPEQEFLDATFPWFEPRTAPMNASELPQLIGEPPLSDRLREIGLRYLVWIDGTTQRTDQSGSLTCSVSPAGGGCFGFLTWENDSSYEASVWDIRSGRSVGKISSDSVGTSYMPAVILPLPIIAPVQSSACSTLGDQLRAFLQHDG